MKWISTFGGPYIFADKSRAKKWLGIDGISLEGEEAFVARGMASDYDIACDTNSIAAASLLDQRFADILIVSGGCHMTWHEIGENRGLLVKSTVIDTDDEFLPLVESLDLDGFQMLPCEFLVKSGALKLFDSALDWKRAEADDNYMSMDLNRGPYSVGITDATDSFGVSLSDDIFYICPSRCKPQNIK